jgi:FkbH-like protein
MMQDEDGDADVPRRPKRKQVRRADDLAATRDIKHSKLEDRWAPPKLVVWDLDGTIWNGVLDEGPIAFNETATSLVRALAGRGIINSVCSKNDRRVAEQTLEAAKLSHYFVANEISFDLEKGTAVGRILTALGLLPTSALFVDDSARERAAVLHANEGVQIADPAGAALGEIAQLIGGWGRPDPELTRVSQCRILERKAHSLNSSTSAEAFLRNSKIVARITRVGGTDPDLDRILELLNRTNRLNWTRIRYASSWHVLEQDTCLVNGATEATSWKVRVRDRFGDYGVVGFITVREGEIRHLAFSCRCMGMRIEAACFQWLRRKIGSVRCSFDTDALTQDASHVHVEEDQDRADVHSTSAQNPTNLRLLARGWCATAAIAPYLEAEHGWHVERTPSKYDQQALIPLHTFRAWCESDSRVRATMIELVGCGSDPFEKEAAVIDAQVGAIVHDMESEILWPV